MCIYLQIRILGKNPRPVWDYYNNEKLKLFFYADLTAPPLFFCSLGEFEVDCKKTEMAKKMALETQQNLRAVNSQVEHKLRCAVVTGTSESRFTVWRL